MSDFGVFCCPACGGTDVVRQWHTIRFQRILGVSCGAVVTENDSEEGDLDDDKEHFCCESCQHTWPTKGVKFTDTWEVERRKAVRGVLLTLQGSHKMMMVKPADLRPGDWQLVDNTPRLFKGHQTPFKGNDGWQECAWQSHDGHDSFQALAKDELVVIFRKGE